MRTSTASGTRSAVASRPQFKEKYDHCIGGSWIAPLGGDYFYNISPIAGKLFTKATRYNSKDIDLAIDAATGASKAWSKTSAGYRSNLLLKIAQVTEDNQEYPGYLRDHQQWKSPPGNKSCIFHC